MKLAVAAVASLLLLLLAATAGAVSFSATNNATATLGGQRFDLYYGTGYAEEVLSGAACFIWELLHQTRAADRRPVDGVTFVVDDTDFAIAYTENATIVLSAGYVGNYTAGDVATEVTGVLFHESTHVWQWDGQGTANGGLIEGIADFVRLRAGYAPAHWRKPGQGDRWDQGYDITARFLDYCDSLRPGFVAELNALMKDGYSDGFFVQILGKTVQELWGEYKAKYYGGQ